VKSFLHLFIDTLVFKLGHLTVILKCSSKYLAILRCPFLVFLLEKEGNQSYIRFAIWDLDTKCINYLLNISNVQVFVKYIYLSGGFFLFGLVCWGFFVLFCVFFLINAPKMWSCIKTASLNETANLLLHGTAFIMVLCHVL